MGLLDSIAEDERELENMIAEGDTEKEEIIEEEIDEAVEEEIKEEEPTEQVEEEKQEEEAVKEEVTEDKSLENKKAYENYRLREKARKADEYERKIAELEAKLTQPAQQQANKSNVPDKEQDYVGWLESELSSIKEKVDRQERQKEEERLMYAAENNFKQFENSFKQTVPDYDDVAKFALQEIAASYIKLNPKVREDQLPNLIKQRVLEMAAEFYSEGLNPAEAMYHMAKEKYGYKPTTQEAKEDRPAARKPDLTVVATNKKKSGMLGAKGNSGAPLTTGQGAIEMSNAEFSQLSERELDRILAEGR